MKKLHKVLGIVTVILLFFTMICGFWMHGTYPGAAVPESSIQFHLWLGTATGLCLLATVVSLFIKKK